MTARIVPTSLAETHERGLNTTLHVTNLSYTRAGVTRTPSELGTHTHTLAATAGSEGLDSKLQKI